MTIRTKNVKVSLETILEKDLQENEVICSSCNGTGVQVTDNKFGIKEDKNKHSAMFPYKNQSITFCQHCFNGVQKKCKHCNQLLGRNSHCDCDDAKKERKEKQRLKELKLWEKANKVSVEEYSKENDGNMLYLENYDKFFSDIDDILEFLKDEFKKDGLNREEISKIHIFRTEIDYATFDAGSIMEDATSELHENAYDNIMTLKDELQRMLDEFSEKMKQETATFFPNYHEAVIVTLYDLWSEHFVMDDKGIR